MHQEIHINSQIRLRDQQQLDERQVYRQKKLQLPHSPSSTSTIRLSDSGKRVLNQRKKLRKGRQIIFQNQYHTQSQKRISAFSEQKGICKICELVYDNSQLISLSNCDHLFCYDCLYQYVILKITFFEEILCPYQQCNEKISKQSKVYNNLSKKMKKKVNQNQNFFYFVNNKTKKPCRFDYCNGVMQLNDENKYFKCLKCNQIFCSSCLNKVHKGECDNNVAISLQRNLGYRQCSSCKTVVEKNQGCQHITCKCGYQFCYICGQKYQAGHICPMPKIPQNLNIIQQMDWLLSHRPDLIGIFHLNPNPYVHFISLILMGRQNNVGKIKILRGILFMLIGYPLSLIVSLIHLLYALILIHIFLIIVFLILFPYWVKIVIQDRQLDIYFKQKRGLMIICIILCILFFPLVLIGLVIYCMGYYWICNNSNNSGLLTITKKQLRGNLCILITPLIVYKRSN